MNKKKEQLINSKRKEINEILNGMELNDLFVVLGNVVLDVFYNMKDNIPDFDKSIANWLSNLAKHVLLGDMIDTGDQLAS